MRDDESHPVAEELRDVHRRIDALKEESERHYDSLTDKFAGLTDKLHGLEVAVARGNRFPAAAWVAATGIFLTVVGTGAVTFSKLEAAAVTGNKAITLIESHMAGSSARFETIQEASRFMADWGGRLPLIEERVKSLEGRIVGQGPEGWHRKDHDLYAKMIDERNERIKLRLDTVEKRQEEICQRVRQCK